MSESKKILIVEDDENIAELLLLHLSKEGFEVTHCSEGHQGIEHVKHGGFDALILDLMLPGVDGLEICRFARTLTRYTPIIIISARSSETQRVLGLELGADDYLAKPFSMLELVARVKALFRRQKAMSQDLHLESGFLCVAGLSIDPLGRTVHLNQQPIELTPREFDLLYYFARHPEAVFSRLDLLNNVWGYQHEGYEHTVNTHINRLRIKIEANPAEPDFIRTVWGKGYKFSPGPRE
ncbi:response regulator transcription factor [Citrobacter sp. JGM124]|uniref:response regulator transcription factor n=1 Tax=Citrobacter sp. JGM124 TaxID=2799789 RepID=UPI001BA976D4|nr:response regulator transcription factor [Citrobacter sp. JGM124]MBS0849356.1 response regulator transcription factor [Citrobacter sp. JGM124]